MKRLILLLALALPVLLQAQEAESEAKPEISKQDKIKTISQFTNVQDLLLVGQGAYNKKEYDIMQAAFVRLRQLRPYRSDYQFMLAKSYALQDNKTSAYDILVKLKEQGLSFNMKGDADFENLRGYQLYDFLEQGFADNAKPFGPSEVVATIPRGDLLVEGVVYDAERKRYLLGSLTEGKVFSLDDKGRLKTFIEASDKNGLLGVAGLAIDEQRGHLWISSSASAHFKDIQFKDAGRAGLYKFDLKSGKFLARYDVPGGGSHFLMYVAVAPDGTVFVSDSVQPVVFRLKPDSETIDRLFSAPGFSGIRGLAVHPSSSHLYFSDYELGLFGVELESGRSFQIELDMKQNVKANLSGVEGLFWYEDSLVMIQNGHQPQRILRLQLSEDGSQAVHSQPLLSAHESFYFPTSGTIIDGKLVVVSESHRNLYDPKTGQPVEGVELQGPQLVTADLGYQWRALARGQ